MTRPGRRRHIHRRVGTPLAAAAVPPDMVLPLVVLVCWVGVWLLILLRRREDPAPRLDEPWLRPLAGPVVDDPWSELAEDGWEVPDAIHEVGLLVVPPDQLGTLDDVGGAAGAAALLDDLVGPVLDAGRREHHRRWGGVLLEGDHTEAVTLARAVAGEHCVPLLSIRAAAVVASDYRSAAEPVFRHAEQLAPCVLLIDRIDELDEADADLVVSRRTRRIVSELAHALRALPRDGGVVVIGAAHAAADVAPRLREDGCLDRQVSIGAPTAAQCQRILRREALLHGAILDGQFDELLGVVEDLAAGAIVELVGRACREARRRRPFAQVPLLLTAADLRAALHADEGSAALPLAVPPEVDRRLRELLAVLRDPRGHAGLVVAGLPGNGATTVARWIAARSPRTTVWVRGEDIAALPMEDVDALMAGAVAQVPVLVVLDGMDDVLADDDRAPRRRKHLLAGIGQLLDLPGAAVVVTVHDPDLVDVPDHADGGLDVLWLAHPAYHQRVELLGYALRGADLVDITLEELAAALIGRTRRQLAAVCARALRVAALRRAGRPRVYRRDVVGGGE